VDDEQQRDKMMKQTKGIGAATTEFSDLEVRARVFISLAPSMWWGLSPGGCGEKELLVRRIWDL